MHDTTPVSTVSGDGVYIPVLPLYFGARRHVGQVEPGFRIEAFHWLRHVA